MNHAVFRLESFSSSAAATAEVVRQEDLQDAYERGLADGQAAAASAELRSLAAAIGAVAAQFADMEQIRAEATRQTAADLLPILSEIVTALAREPESAGLERALRQEVQRLAASVPPRPWHILCPAAMEPMVRRCVEMAGLTDADIRTGPAVEAPSIILDEGRSAFSNHKVAERFRDQISELQESYR